jgi:hypothetical protein
MLRPGGVAVFQEYDFSVKQSPYPPVPLYDQVWRVFQDVFSKVAHVDMGAQLFHLAVAAGFNTPDCCAEYPIEGGAQSPVYLWIAESLRSILPRAEALGVARAADFDIDTLASRLEQQALSGPSGLAGPAMIGCFARKP